MRRGAAPAAGPSPPAGRTWRARSPAGSTARRRRRSGSGRRCCAAAAPAGTPVPPRQPGLFRPPRRPVVPHTPRSHRSRPQAGEQGLVVDRSRHLGVGAGTASIRRPRRAPADSPSVVSASQSARSLTRVGSAAANAVDAVVRGAAGDRAISVGDRVPQVADQRLGRAQPHRARARDGQRVRGGREHGGELAQPAEIGRVERPGPPDVRVIGADRRQQPAAGDQAHARGRGRRPDPDAAPHRPPRLLTGVTQQRAAPRRAG